ncbi:clathrin light chain A-like [Ptychodera flava]|uniref:clathrin light chain A-like n=1 Tax=Ptychodera flava TaxID=63121 RepID=UPI00396A6055
MADLLGDDQPQNADSGVEEDPAAAFLAREQDQLAGIEDDSFEINSSEPAGEQPAEAAAPVQDNIDFISTDAGIGDEVPQSNGPTDNYSAISQMDVHRQEPEKIKRWREEQKELLEQKDAESEKKQTEWREIAKKELEDWYRQRDEQLQKTVASNRATEEAFIEERDETIPGQEWERVARLCDFNPKNNKTTRDVSRMRSILLQLKQTGIQRE